MNLPIAIQNIMDGNPSLEMPSGKQLVSEKNGIFAALMRQASQRVGNDAQEISGAYPGILKGHALVAHIKKGIQACGVSLDQCAVDDNSLTAVGKALVGAGFDSSQVKGLLNELKVNAGQKGVRLSTLFAGISRLTEPASTNETKYLEISSLPHIETLLAKFGLTPDEIKSAIESSKTEGKGIDANKLVYALKKIRSNGRLGKKESQDEGDSEEISALMQQIGLTVQQHTGKTNDISDFISALDKYGSRQSISKHALMSGHTGINPLGCGNHLKSRQQSSEESRLSLDKFAAELENMAQSKTDMMDNQRSGPEWSLFVRGIRSVSDRVNGLTDIEKTRFLLEKESAYSSSEKLNSIFSDPSFFQALSGEDTAKQPSVVSPLLGAKAVGKGVFSQHMMVGKNGFSNNGTTGQMESDLTGAFEMNESESKKIIETIAGGEAKAAIRGGEPLIGSSGSTRRSVESTPFIWTEGMARSIEASGSSVSSAANSSGSREFPQYLLDQVSRQIIRSRLLNENEILLQLKPPDLGRLKMSIANTSEGLKVSIVAENQAAKDMLLANSGDLKTALMDQGLRLDRIDVQTQADFSQTMADAHTGSQSSDERRRFSAGNRELSSIGSSGTETDKPALIDVGMVNLVA